MTKLLGTALLPIGSSVRADATLYQQFDAQLQQALGDVEAIDAAREYRDGLADYFDRFVHRGAGAPRVKPSRRRIAQRAIDMIIGFEVSGQIHYERALTHPVRPGGDSGITIGIGYDLGYKLTEWFREDWAGLLKDDTFDRLANACGAKGLVAARMLPDFADITVDWIPAHQQFVSTSLPRWIGQTLAVLPKSAGLSDESLGALVSLVMNRGASFNGRGDAYLEMNAIRDCLADGRVAAIPEEFRKMVRLWKEPAVSAVDAVKLRGLVSRRNVEASLFQAGLISPSNRPVPAHSAILPRPARLLAPRG